MEKEDVKDRHLKAVDHIHQDITSMNIQRISNIMEAVLADLRWLTVILEKRTMEVRNENSTPFSFALEEVPELVGDNPYSQLIKQLDLSNAERLLLIASLVRYIEPELFTRHLRDEKRHIELKYPEFGGYIEPLFTNFVPTLQTILFLLSGSDRNNQTLYKWSILQGKLVKEGIVRFSPYQNSDSGNELMQVPHVATEYVQYLQSATQPRPDFGRAFPATWVSTGLEWEQLILRDETKQELREVMRWVEHGENLREISDQFNPSYPCLFYGPPGTGKSLTAKLIGKRYNKDVFRVDLSMIVSKYVGETEKNLAHLFDRATNKDWILFFDEADALFSRRTDVSGANDKWANLEVSYLLQRMEEHHGLTILATNLRENIDPAMTRRFQSIIYFSRPGEKERLEMWKNLLPNPFSYQDSISPKVLSRYELSGANISNILKDACLAALDDETHVLNADLLRNSIRKEFVKEKRTP